MALRSRRSDFADKDWLPATVPGTVLSSYWNDGALPDPNYGDNQLAISDSFFYADFWYRDEFIAPALAAGQTCLAELRRHQLEGGRVSQRRTSWAASKADSCAASFDVTGKLLRAGQKNALAVRIFKERHARQRQGEDLCAAPI